MYGIWILLGTTVVLVLLGVLEYIGHQRSLRHIPIRIHVNGTRGKSSVTRLIAAGLREAGICTCAKTTGTLARMILPDGSEYPVYRPVRPNVVEQVRIVRMARAFDAQALVIECMALQPYLQWLCELKLVRATHGVITNARPDHLDVMGPTDRDVAWALAGMTPYGGVLFTAEQKHRDVYEQSTLDRACSLVKVGEGDVAGVTAEELAGFSYVEHSENVALAIKVCESLGVSRQTALRGMWSAMPDPGVMTADRIEYFGRTLVFVNGFAANDPDSTQRIWEHQAEAYRTMKKRIAIFNCRADRPDRSWQLGQACVQWSGADTYVLMGTGTYIFARAAMQNGLESARIVFAENRRADEIFEIVLHHAGNSALVMGMGNIGGQGLELVRYFRNRSVLLS